MKLSLVIPCYNEDRNIPLLLERCGDLAKLGEVEVILVDNGSTDNSPQVLASLLPNYPGCRSVRVEVNQGYGYGILSGLREAEGDVLAWTHADMQTDPHDVIKGLEIFNQCSKHIFVKGKRYGRPVADVFFTIGMSIFETLLLGTWLWDINAQPTMFSREFFATWKNPPNDFSLDLYAYFMARKAGQKIQRFPVLFAERAHGVSHWNVNWSAKRKFIKRTVVFSMQLKQGIFAEK